VKPSGQYSIGFCPISYRIFEVKIFSEADAYQSIIALI
jgi:hypothetical protein